MSFAEWAAEVGLPNHCRLHGLKKGGMRRLAQSGATGHELMAISGHHKLAMVEHYTADADRKKLADRWHAETHRERLSVNPARPQVSPWLEGQNSRRALPALSIGMWSIKALGRSRG
jgi:hypothetical protein